jgi:cytidine deaminase
MNDTEATYRKLIAAAKEAANLAYRPYSNYPVGAAVLTFDGSIYTGCNIENCGYTQTIHAEQTAMSKAISEGALERALAQGLTQLEFIKAVAVHAPKGTDPWPCGNCRQSLNEFGLQMEIIGDGPNGDILCETLGQLVPHAFAMDLVFASIYGENWKSVILDKAGKAPHVEQVTNVEADADKRRLLIEHAKKAAQLAYCPYSKYPVGAAVQTFDGKIYTGCNIENCGYTQTIHAEQVAVAKAISEGALARAKETGLTHRNFIETIAIYSPKTSEPWPSCNGRQSLSEFGLDMEIVGENKNGALVSKKLKDLVPFAFEQDLVLASINE